MIIDLHCHSRFTRGCDLDPRVLLKRGAALGLDAICFTELNSIDAAAELHELGRNAPIPAFVGMELSTDRGHYLCYFPDPEAVPDPVQMWGSNHERPWPAHEVLDKVIRLGGVVAVAHPYDRETPVAAGDFIFGLKELTAIEAFNPRRKAQVNNLAAEAAVKLKLPGIAGSDARRDLSELGKAATVFKRRVANERELCLALRGGECWPVLFGGVPPGLFRGGEVLPHKPGSHARAGKPRKRGLPPGKRRPFPR